MLHLSRYRKCEKRPSIISKGLLSICRCRAIAETYLTRSSPASTWATSRHLFKFPAILLSRIFTAKLGNNRRSFIQSNSTQAVFGYFSLRFLLEQKNSLTLNTRMYFTKPTCYISFWLTYQFPPFWQTLKIP